MISRRKASIGALSAAESIPAVSVLAKQAPTNGMRVSALDEDPGRLVYDEILSRGLNVDIFLDGVKQELVVTADSSLGYIQRCKKNENGEFDTREGGVEYYPGIDGKLVKTRKTIAETEILRGSVVIVVSK